MEFPKRFVSATSQYTTLESPVPAPYIRRNFVLEAKPQSAELLITGVGFYEVYVNGVNCTKGPLAPYISAPDDLIYFDCYQVAEHLEAGQNVIAVILGNGMQNDYSSGVWDFNIARWRGAPQLAFRLMMDEMVIEADEQCLTTPSPILCDGLRTGETYDARNEIAGWNLPGFDDGGWTKCIFTRPPAGIMKVCTAEPIAVQCEIAPVSVIEHQGGYMFDFGVNRAGVCRLAIEAQAGQKLEIYYGEHLHEGKFDRRGLAFHNLDYIQKETYITKDGLQTHTPIFTYHGFRYVLIKGLMPHQAMPATLTYLVMNSDMPQRGHFACSDKVVNRLQEMTLVADYANFFYFPNDCPTREKNGWTADAALSAEHMLLNFGAEKSYYEWLHNIRRAQRDDGALPGIVPTGGWGFEWGNGPAWDCVIVCLPYDCYRYRGDAQVIRDNAHAMLRYLSYLSTRIGEDGLVAIGLGDWVPVGRDADDYKAPLCLTDTIVSMDICRKAAYLFGEIGMDGHRDFALGLHAKLRAAARAELIDTATKTALGDCQTSQAMAIFYDVFDEGEKPAAYAQLRRLIEQSEGHMDVGVLGGRVLFHVLAAHGDAELALDMIIRPEYPSYAHWIEQGATSLFEIFTPDNDAEPASYNHHFWGDISHWFYRHLLGIHYKPNGKDGTLDIRPCFVSQLDWASGWHDTPQGRVSVAWHREGDDIVLAIEVPEGLRGHIRPEPGVVFEDGVCVKPLASGTYRLAALAKG